MSDTTVDYNLTRHPLVEERSSFEELSDAINDPVEAKPPSWWLIGFVGAGSSRKHRGVY